MQITKKHLTKNRYTRPGQPLERLTGIVVHYTDSATKTFSRDFDWLFELLNTTFPAEKHYGCYHYAIDQEGSTYELIPPTEIAWHAGALTGVNRNTIKELGGEANFSTLAIAFLHPDPSGKPTEETYKSLIELISFLIEEHGIDPRNLYRHDDCATKLCPKYYVENEDEWLELKRDIYAKLNLGNP
jgi:N-acetylmuramoyl-L-alanine amidase CwlA